MRISELEAFVVNDRRLLLKVSTDKGLVGWGEPTLENWAVPVAAVVQQMGEYLVGKDPRRITHHWQVLTRGGFYRGGPVFGSAVAGVDQALWDLTARSFNAPVYELLGGATRDQVRVYAHANFTEVDDCEYPARAGNPALARKLIDHGYSLVKVAPERPTGFVENEEAVDAFVGNLTAIREAIGPHNDFAVDLHGRFSVAQSRRVLKRIEHLMPAFVEEPLRPEHSTLIGRIVSDTLIPIATGERLYSRAEFRGVLEAGVAIVQPDLSHAGGISECVRIASQAEIYDAQIAPHCPLGPVALAACLQVDFAVPNFFAQESVIDAHDPFAQKGQELIHNPEALRVQGGRIRRLEGPGLGVDVNEDAVRAAAARARSAPLRAPLWFHGDGSFAEW